MTVKERPILFSGDMGTYPMGPKTEEANARLIAAAPELLEALLEMAEDYCEMCRDECRNGGCVKFPEEAVNGNSMYPVCENVKRAKKAIAKAKGEA